MCIERMKKLSEYLIIKEDEMLSILKIKILLVTGLVTFIALLWGLW